MVYSEDIKNRAKCIETSVDKYVHNSDMLLHLQNTRKFSFVRATMLG